MKQLVSQCLFVIAVFCVAVRPANAREQEDKVAELSFKDLKFSIAKGEEFRDEMIPESVRKHHGKPVRISGFIFPGKGVERQGNTLFVLVRDNQESFPLPIYESIIVRLKTDETANFTVRPITVTGEFRVIEKSKLPDGQVYAVYEIVDGKVDSD